MGRWLILLIAGALILAWALRRDIRYSKAYPGDLRYRVVGARLVRDGHLPYQYKWRPGDGLRYYDPDNFDSLKAANITVSPFYLHLLAPIADLPQSQIIGIWLVSEYLLLAMMTVLAISWTKKTGQKQTVLAFALLFLLTNAWKLHIAYGQTYLWIAALAMLFYACLRQPPRFAWGLVAGTLAATLVLIRPNTIIFFLPFLFLARRYPRSWWIALALPPLLLAGWTVGSKTERELWWGYNDLVHEYEKWSQDLGPATAHNVPDPHFARWEGIDKPAADSLSTHATEKIYTENGNAFVLFRLLFHRQLPPLFWIGTALVLIAVALGVFYVRHRPFTALPPEQLAIVAFCCYMITDLLSPIYRHQYYTVQWFFPLLLTAATATRPQRKWIGGLSVCLLLIAIHIPFLRMQNTLAEYSIMALLLTLNFRT
jgi:hypothetical protein